MPLDLDCDRSFSAADDAPWAESEHLLLAAVDERLRERVEAVLANPRRGGRGLRAWVAALAADPRPLPDAIPASLVEVYLTDAEAMPLHDCGDCGLAVPVRPHWRAGHEAPPEHVYFAACPHCGGRTGRHAFWARAAARC